MIYRSHSRPAARKGIILLVVLALLTLFAIAGLAFVFYAQSRADSARVYRESQLQSLSTGPDTPPDVLFDDWLRQFIFDVADYQGGGNTNFLNSAMRGHSLARNMFGGPPSGAYTVGAGWSSAPYSGTGRLHTASAGTGAGGIDDFGLVNYTLYTGDNREPESFGGGRANFSVPYTYPDMNNMYLAAVRADGSVISPSYYRKWSFDPSGLGMNNLTNANWTNGQGKYMLLRPRPQENPGFPFPTDSTGDVKNLTGSPGGNDSIWMDIGSPVKALPDGTLYKPLYAALIVDLDGRVNLNVAGNIRGTSTPATPQLSNSGIGPWEMNLKDVLYVDTTEWPKIFQGNGATMGRYGANGQPDVSIYNNSAANLTPTGNNAVGQYFYNPYDYDGGNAGAPSATWVMPTGVGVAFPSKPAGYASGAAAELTQHPQLYSILSPGGDDTTFSVGSMKSLLYVGPTGSTASTSTLGKLCPNTLGASTPAATRAQRLVTTISWDPDLPGITPALDGTQPYQFAAAGAVFPTALAQNFPAVGIVTGGTAEFSLGGQATEVAVAGASKLGRIDLNRRLTDYPAPGQDGRIDTTNPAFNQAVSDRQSLAGDIYIRLVQVTGAFNQFTNSGTPSQPQVDALRYLAQLAVNMVDYIDVDDYMTPFNWVSATTSTGQTTLASFSGAISASSYALDPIGKGWAFGTEIPRLTLNECHAEIDNDTGDTQGNTNFNLNFWAEFYNPFTSDPNLWNSGGAMLQMGTGSTGQAKYAVYQLVVTGADSTAGTPPSVGMRAANNTLGNPTSTMTPYLTVADWTPDANNAFPQPQAGIVGAAGALGGTGSISVNLGANAGTAGWPNTACGNNVFFVAGPGSNTSNKVGMTATNTGPNLPYTLPVNLQTSATTKYTDSYTSTTYNSGMSYRLTKALYAPPATATPCKTTPGTYAFLLRRLACPHLPPNFTPGASYNPYITVDYVDSVQAYDAVTQLANAAQTPTWANIKATGKQQPYASLNTQWAQQTTAAAFARTGGNAGPNNTFFAQNSNPPPSGNFNWLTHLDRPLISPMELLQVSGFKPHELTQQFINGTNPTPVDASNSPNYQHRAPWSNVSSRLYRVFELLETKSRLPGMQVGGRLPGKININTIWDPEVFRALCDPQTSNSAGGFSVQADVDAIYTAMMGQRSPQYGAAALSGSDQPFMGMAAGYDTNTAIGAGGAQYQPGDGRSGPGGISNNNTLLAQSGGKFLFEGPATAATTHPYLRAMLLNKIYNNVTTRSNVFGVWLTVGFFQVTNVGTTPPPALTTEWGQSTGQNIRHHMFAIVDRSTLGVQTAAALTTGAGAITSSGLQTVNVASMPATIVPGAVLMIDDAPNQESVVVRTVTGTSFTATFNKTHTAGFKIYGVTPGNPGPQPTFGAKSSSALVPYYTIID